jgi:nitrite reductase/ring-hydroxylating ferredoxin subunit
MSGQNTQETLGDQVAPDEADTAVTTRRAVLVGGGAACMAMLLSACGGSDPAETTVEDDDDHSTAAASSAPATTGGPDPGPAVNALAKVSDLPKGGGKIVGGVLLVRLADGSIKAYDPHCTHQGFIVDLPKDNKIVCENHGSVFKPADGSVVNGPATRSLRVIAVKVDGDNIIRS